MKKNEGERFYPYGSVIQSIPGGSHTGKGPHSDLRWDTAGCILLRRGEENQRKELSPMKVKNSVQETNLCLETPLSLEVSAQSIGRVEQDLPTRHEKQIQLAWHTDMTKSNGKKWTGWSNCFTSCWSPLDACRLCVDRKWARAVCISHVISRYCPPLWWC